MNKTYYIFRHRVGVPRPDSYSQSSLAAWMSALRMRRMEVISFSRRKMPLRDVLRKNSVKGERFMTKNMDM